MSPTHPFPNQGRDSGLQLKSPDLLNWTPTGEKVRWNLPVVEGTRLFRLKMAAPAPTE